MKMFFVALSAISFILMSLFLTACSNPEPQTVAKTLPDPEPTLIVVASDPQSSPENSLGIYNAYDKEQVFVIEPCQFCEFDVSEVAIPSKSSVFINFTASKAGDKTIVVRDKLNNYYAKTVFTVVS